MAESSDPVLAGHHLGLVINTTWFFLSHRVPIATAAMDRGMRVTLLAGESSRRRDVEALGVGFRELGLTRAGTNPLREAMAVAELASAYRAERFDLVHHVTPKPVIYGSLAARTRPGLAVVNAISGLGYAFTGSGFDWRRAIIGTIASRAYKTALSHPRSKTIFQNPDDLAFFEARGLVDPGRAVLIRGSGVSLSRFVPTPEPAGTIVVMFPSRLLRDKGVLEFVDAARRLKASGHVDVRMVLVGDVDPGNPASVTRPEVESWVTQGCVEWWGHRADMPATLAAAHVVALPTYREGLPKVLLEAAASGRPLIASDAPGSREVCLNEHNGLVVPVKDAPAIARSVVRLVSSRHDRERFGRNGRALVERSFGVDMVVDRTLDVYRSLLGA